MDNRNESEKIRDTMEAYRITFRTPMGREVLADILNDCGFMSLDDLNNPADIARLNVGKKILGKAGIWIPRYCRQIVDAFLDLPIPTEGIENVKKKT